MYTQQATQINEQKGLISFSLQVLICCVSLQLYFKVVQENLALKEKLQEMELLLSQNKVELEQFRQVGQVW